MLRGFVRITGLILLLVLPAVNVWAQLPLIQDADGSPTLAPLLKRVTPSVVNVAVVGQVKVRRDPSFDNPFFDDPLFDRFFDLPTQPEVIPQQGIGSGVIIDAENGYVITNHHVIEVADEIAVTLADGRRMDAELVGSDPETDIALLRIPADDLTAIPLGDSDELEVGDFVIAIGNPFRPGQTVTSGIVSALRQSGQNIEGYEDFVQTDASINRGNSGGALVDIHGALVRINTAIVPPVGGSVRIGFAIPISMARQVMTQLLEYREVCRGRLGIIIQDLTPALAEALELEAAGGAIITQVEPDSPAEGAGLRAGVECSRMGAGADSFARQQNYFYRYPMMSRGSK